MALRLSTLTGAAAACALLLGGTTLVLHLASRLASRPLVAGGEALGFALTFGLGYGGCYALVQSKAALHFGHRRGFKPLQGFLFVWQMAGTALDVKRKAHLDSARTASCRLGSVVQAWERKEMPGVAPRVAQPRPIGLVGRSWWGEAGGERLAGDIAPLLSS